MRKRNEQRWLMVVLILAMSAAACAQRKTPDTTQTKPSPATSAPAATPTPTPVMNKTGTAPQAVSPGQAVYLVRSILMMLNDANRSGNYTVLRDLAAPEFQARNSAADLALAFSDMRKRRFDLFAVSFAAPQFTPDPTIGPDGKVRLAGFFATQPLRIKFDMTFQVVGGEWKLFAISVATPEAPKQQSELVHPRPQGKVKPFYGLHLYQGIAGIRW